MSPPFDIAPHNAGLKWGGVTLALALLASSQAWAGGAKIAVHPLEAPTLRAEDQSTVRAFFDVMIARVKSIRLTGSTRVEQALTQPQAHGCATDDGCLRFLANATASHYAVYAELRVDPSGKELAASARVVRSDGEVVRRVTLHAPRVKDLALTDTANELLQVLVKSLELGKLSDSDLEGLVLPPAPDRKPAPHSPRADFPSPRAESRGGTPNSEPQLVMVLQRKDSFSNVPPPLVSAEPLNAPGFRMTARQAVGAAMFGIGMTTAATGAILWGLAAGQRQGLTPDANGSVPASQVRQAASAAHEAQLATILIPVGAAVSVVGGLLALWPEHNGVSVSVGAASGGGGLVLGGKLP